MLGDKQRQRLDHGVKAVTRLITDKPLSGLIKTNVVMKVAGPPMITALGTTELRKLRQS